MNIYFACSITGGREFEGVYQALARALTEAGHEVPTAYLAESGIPALEAGIDPLEVYTRDTAWIRVCDALVAEVSVPSHGVGYEIAYSLGLGKPVLALFRVERRVSKMISGNPDPNLTLKGYETVESAVLHIREFLSERDHNL